METWQLLAQAEYCTVRTFESLQNAQAGGFGTRASMSLSREALEDSWQNYLCPETAAISQRDDPLVGLL